MFGCLSTRSKQSDEMKSASNQPTLVVAADRPVSGALHFASLWHYTEDLLSRRSSAAVDANHLISSWPGADTPHFIAEFLKSQLAPINEFRARLNSWFLRNQTPFLSEERALEMYLGSTHNLAQKSTGPVRDLMVSIRGAILGDQDLKAMQQNINNAITQLHNDVIARTPDQTCVYKRSDFVKLRQDLHDAICDGPEKEPTVQELYVKEQAEMLAKYGPGPARPTSPEPEDII